MTTNDELQKTGEGAYLAIVEMVAALQCDYDRLAELNTPELNEAINNLIESDEASELVALREAAGECTDQDDARERIEADALSIEVRSGWQALGETLEATEFCILLSTGGPATRIIGELNEHREPCRAWLEVQDWGTAWAQYYVEGGQDVLLAYASVFYFGE